MWRHIGDQIAQNRRRLGNIQQLAFQRIVQPVQHDSHCRTPHITAPGRGRAAQNEHILHPVHILDRVINLVRHQPGFGQGHAGGQFD